MLESEFKLIESHEPKRKRKKVDNVNGIMDGNNNWNYIIPWTVKHLSSLEDIKNCFILSSSINDGIYAEPDVMRKLKFSIINADKKSAIKFLLKRGYLIRYLDIKVDWKFGRSLKYALSKLEKLIELSFEENEYGEEDFDENEFYIKSDEEQDVTKKANLSNLKTLKIYNFGSWKNIKENSKNLINLTKLTAKFEDDEKRNIFTDFLCQQNKLVELNFEDTNDDFEFPDHDISTTVNFKLNKLQLSLSNIHKENFFSFLTTQASNLQVLELEVTDTSAFNFPSRDISKEINLKLRVLKISHPNIHIQNFTNFLRTQALCLQELELYAITHKEVFEMIFINFKVLEKFTIDEEGSEIILGETFSNDLTLDSLRYFHDKNQNGTTIEKLLKYFPKIEILKCCDTMEARGTSETLTTLDVSEVYWPRIRHFKMPNLKNLFIKKIARCDDDYYWTHFTENFLNIENITVEKVGNETKDVLRFVKRLKAFKKLKTFKLRHGIAIDHNYSLDDNELVEVENNFFKILIDTTSKTVKLSTYIVQNCEEEMLLLRESFKDFEFFEFCFEELKMQQI